MTRSKDSTMLAVGLDFDGTVADTNTLKAHWIKEHLGISIEPHLCDWTNCVPIIGQDAYREMANDVFGREAAAIVRPIPGALDVIRRLRAVREVVIVTARTGERMEIASDWLSAHEATRGMRVIGVNTREVSKVQRCLEEEIGALVEDDERHLYDARSQGVEAVLFRMDGPEDLRCDYADLCRSWDEIGRVLGVG